MVHFLEAVKNGTVDALVVDNALANTILANQCNYHQVRQVLSPPFDILASKDDMCRA
jgi:hypothetical protein